MRKHLSEKQWLAMVRKAARLHGWMVYHTYDSRRSEPGFPDLVLARPGDPIIIAELKTDTGRLRPEQTVWLDVLARASGVAVHVWRPRDWDEIIRRLQGE